jgi:hypothetical protein
MPSAYSVPMASDVLPDPDTRPPRPSDDNPAAGVEHESGRLQVYRVVVDEGSGGGCDGTRVGAVTDGELQAVPGDQFLGGGFVVDGPSTDAAPQAMPKSNTGQLILALDGR